MKSRVLYVKSVAYTELRDYKNADIAFQKGFDIFLKNGKESLSIADEYAAKNLSDKRRQRTRRVDVFDGDDHFCFG